MHLCLFAGLRREEALGLRWGNVHLEAVPPYLDVSTACSWQGKNQAVVSETLKSAAARRSIPLPPPLVESLTALKAAAASDYVICNRSGGAVSATGFRRMWGVIAQRTVRDGYALGDKIKNHNIAVTLDFHVTPHLLRHTYITELVQSGADIVQLTLNIYTHLRTNRPEDTAAQVLKAFGAIPSGYKSGSNDDQLVDNTTL